VTEERNITVNGIPLYYRVSGRGPVAILIHGFGEDGNIWNHQVAALEPHFQVMVPDLPGSGRSPEHLACATITEMARLVKRVMDAEAVEQAAVLGHSMGGYIALAFAELFPQNLSGLGLVHSTAFADSPEKVAARRKSTAFIQAHGAALFLAQAIPNLFAPAYVRTHGGEVAALVQAGNAFTAHTLISYYETMIDRPDRTVVLEKAAVPVLFIIGWLDGAVSPADSLKQGHLPPISYIHILKKAAHMGMLEETEAVSGYMKNYLEAVFNIRAAG
jgi:pimeloyl-ACP methyl ester carboxylesterase